MGDRLAPGTPRKRTPADFTWYCDCPTPTPGWAGVECAECRRLIEGAIGKVLGR